MTATPATQAAPVRAAWVVILAGICAALHIGKLPPALPVLQAELGITLLQAGFLLSVVQVAGMAGGIAMGLASDAIGLRRSMAVGLVVLGLASVAGAWAEGAALLLALRVVEGFGFLLVALPAPGLVRRLVPPQRLDAMLGMWGAYMPSATTLALLIGPLVVSDAGWRVWWVGLGLLSLGMAAWLRRAVPPPPAAVRAAPRLAVSLRLRRTLGASGPWLVALCFAMYAGQWLAVVGFLPSIYVQAGISPAITGVLTATVALVNMAGNVAAGRLLQRGVAAQRLLRAGYVAMGLAAVVAFAQVAGHEAPAALRYLAVLAFSMVGGIIPGTLMALAVRLAPDEHTISTTVGWMQQFSALGQFCVPPAVAWLAGRAQGWQWTWLVTLACSLVGLWLAARVGQLLARRGPAGRSH
ncbi:MAG: MFS transporter [Burkholderiales bacterium]|nr:MFS transporter [Burkholderiales bacterium]